MIVGSQESSMYSLNVKNGEDQIKSPKNDCSKFKTHVIGLSPVVKAEILSDGRSLLCMSKDGEVALWDILSVFLLTLYFLILAKSNSKIS